MTRYTPEFLAVARHGYENTDQPMRELSRELGIGITTLSTLAENNGWAKRSQRKRGLPPAMQLLEEARKLAGTAVASPPPERGRYRRPSAAVLIDKNADAEHRLCCEAIREGVKQDVTPTPTLPLAGGGSALAAAAIEPQPTLLGRMEQILEQLIAAQETAPANGIRSPQSARNLATLIQAMRALNGMRGNASTDKGPIEDDDDDMPTDIDEFRNELARRIRAFFAGRAGERNGDAGMEPGGVGAGGA